MTEPKRKMVSIRLATYKKLIKLGTSGDSINDVIEDLISSKQKKEATE